MTGINDPWMNGCLVVVGISHHTAPVEVRERLALDPSSWRIHAPWVRPSVLLATCNRTEVYAWADRPGARVAAPLARALARAACVPLRSLEPHLFIKCGPDALLHLVRVTSGLDSLVLGDEQIRGQVSRAHRLAQAAGRLPAPLDGVFERALEAARRVRAASAFGRHPSVAAAAIAVARRSPELGSRELTGRVAIVLGAGAMAKAAAQALLAVGAQVAVLNRSVAHAERLARVLGAPVQTGPLEALPRLLPGASLLVGATASRQPLVEASTIRAAVARRDGEPLVILDLAMPRDVEAAARAVPRVRLLDLDDLEQLCPGDRACYRQELERAEALAAAAAQELGRWVRVRAADPAIVELRSYAEQLRAHELQRASAQLRGLSAEERIAVDEVTRAIVRQLLHGPTVALREAAARPRGGQRARSTVLEVLRLDRARPVRRAVLTQP